MIDAASLATSNEMASIVTLCKLPALRLRRVTFVDKMLVGSFPFMDTLNES